MNERTAFLLVARREFVERVRDRSFRISTAVTVLILVVLIVVNSLFSRGTTFDLAVVGPASSGVGRAVVALASAQDVGIIVHTYADEPAAAAALEAGDVDAAVVDGGNVLVKSQPDVRLMAFVQAASASERARASLAQAGLDPAAVQAALQPPPLPVRALEPPDRHRQANSTVAFVGVVLLYGQLFGYGVWVASGVVEEKSTRVIEVLLATVRPSQLLTGKILGIGVLGLLQLLGIGAVGLVTARLVGGLAVPSGAFATALIVLLWFVLGFGFYSCLFAAAGSVVPRQEDLQTTLTPLSLVIVASFFVAITALNSPDSTLAHVASLLPPSAPLVMPPRIVLGQATVFDVALSIGLMLAASAALIPLAARIYSGAVLRSGKVKLRDVVRAERRAARSPGR